MIIQDKIALVYDIEIFPNVFTAVIKNTETKKRTIIEVSKRKNDIALLYDIFENKDYIFVGYNSIHYDNAVVNLLFDFKESVLNSDDYRITKTLFDFSQLIINSEDGSEYKQWKYANNFAFLDLLTMLYSSKLRVGLKEMQVTMQYRNVQEYEGDFTKYLPEEEIDTMIKYNINDVESTEQLLYLCENQVRLREGIQKEFNIDVLSKDGMTIGTEILKTLYLRKTGKKWYDIKDLRTPCDIIKLKNVIFPHIKFDTPLLQNLLKELKTLSVGAGRKAFEKHFIFGGCEVSFGVGGIHTINKPEVIIPKEDEILADSDVNSLYPSLIISYNLVPPHLGKEFLEVYGQIREDRLYAKRNKQKIKNETYKLALNGATGNYQNEHSWLYAPESVMRIRINGQLLLLKLAEMLVNKGAKIKQLNTDGVLYTIKKNVDLDSLLKEWEEFANLTLETEYYDRFYQFAINDYLAVGKGYNESKDKSLLKYKGMFIPTVILGKGMQPMIIPKAINNYLADGIPIEKTIKESRNLNDFLTYQKVDKKFSVEYKNKLITRINRYYMSNSPKAGYLYKCIVDNEGRRTNYSNMLKASGVTIANNLDDFETFPTDINYSYYIREARKITNALECQQIKMFEDF